MYLNRKTRSGRSFMEIVAEDNPGDLAVLQLGISIDMEALVEKALENADTAMEPLDASTPLNTSAPLDTSTPPNTPMLHKPSTLKKRRREEDGERTSTSGTDQPPEKRQSAKNRRRAARRNEHREADGHPRGSGLAFEQHVLTTEPLRTEYNSDDLPIAQGGWVGMNGDYYGAKVKRELDTLKKQGFTHVQWKGKVPVCVTDKDGRVLLNAVGQPNDATYARDCKTMSEEMLRLGRSTEWVPGEKLSQRGRFASASYGWSFGKGQPRPMRLAQRRDMMQEFVSRRDVQRVAAYQSASFALWYPKAYGEYRKRNIELKEKIPEYDGNIKGSAYSCCTANFGPDTWTYIHTDPKNVPGGCCAITAGGPFDPTKGGQLIIWDLKLIFDFPPGSTILLPSALFRHSNIPVQKGDQRVSFTQYTSGGIHRWLEYGGRTEDEYVEQDPEGYERMLAKRSARSKQVLNYFSTIYELKAGVIA